MASKGGDVSTSPSSGGGGEQQLPELPPNSYLSAFSPSLSPSPLSSTRPHTVPTITGPIPSSSVAGIGGGGLGGRYTMIQSPPNSFRGHSPSPNTAMRRSIEFIRVSRQEWEHRDKLISSLRGENLELKTKLKSVTSDTEAHHKLLTSYKSLLLLLSDGTTIINDVNTDTLIATINDKVNQLHKEHNQTIKELTESRTELERVSSDIAAANVQLGNIKTQLEQAKVAIARKESESLQLKSELEVSQQNAARTSTMMQSMKKQLSDKEEEDKRGKQTAHDKQQQIGEIKKQLQDKEMMLELLEEKLKQVKNENEEKEERATVADSAYEDICYQLADSLQVEDECDVEGMMQKVCSLMLQNKEMKQKITILTNSTQLAELDSKANRETIMKLVSDIKKLKEDANKLPALQKTVAELEEKLQTTESERKGFLDRLETSRETIAALKEEIKSQQNSSNELKVKLEAVDELHKNERQAKQQYTDLVNMVARLLSCASIDEDSIKLKLKEINESMSLMRSGMTDKDGVIKGLREQLVSKEREIEFEREKAELEREKLSEMNDQLHNIELLEKQLKKQEEKYKSFIKRCVSSLKLEATTSSIMAGEFAEDSILLKAEQLCNLETQTLAEKQSAVYSLQRKLKSTKQQLESKELHVNLLQRKVTALEERVTVATERETEMQSTMNRGQKMISQFERLQMKMTQQKELIEQLKKENSTLTELKAHYTTQSSHTEQLEKEVLSLQDTRIHLSQQLADARQKLHNAVSVDTERADKCEDTLRGTMEELRAAKDRENKLMLFKTNVQHILASSSSHGATNETEGQGGGGDEELLRSLRQLLSSCQKYKELSHTLQSSLRHMETGFRTNYEDTLALLKNEI
ncbi:PREDICTED: coiled-coil domain-containing protein 170-like [Amphimedon queenslandica]|uniref:Uncharacterized protein n=1 Tax=Amphimedon queenslandica TaxID=400682 RepID=A0A1X7UPS8_AMPQE|nr:PREDICTED: coiled-coil domain-containing protein 170-like [Amphimedon queenslandica]|eukprot:XP_019853081.1 PREDICTED: coiled-coil domain-containing protein 170-like [Amphimedon queenslandica]